MKIFFYPPLLEGIKGTEFMALETLEIDCAANMHLIKWMILQQHNANAFQNAIVLKKRQTFLAVNMSKKHVFILNAFLLQIQPMKLIHMNWA